MTPFPCSSEGGTRDTAALWVRSIVCVPFLPLYMEMPSPLLLSWCRIISVVRDLSLYYPKVFHFSPFSTIFHIPFSYSYSSNGFIHIQKLVCGLEQYRLRPSIFWPPKTHLNINKNRLIVPQTHGKIASRLWKVWCYFAVAYYSVWVEERLHLFLL